MVSHGFRRSSRMYGSASSSSSSCLSPPSHSFLLSHIVSALCPFMCPVAPLFSRLPPHASHRTPHDLVESRVCQTPFSLSFHSRLLTIFVSSFYPDTLISTPVSILCPLRLPVVFHSVMLPTHASVAAQSVPVATHICRNLTLPSTGPVRHTVAPYRPPCLSTLPVAVLSQASVCSSWPSIPRPSFHI